MSIRHLKIAAAIIALFSTCLLAEDASIPPAVISRSYHLDDDAPPLPLGEGRDSLPPLPLGEGRGEGLVPPQVTADIAPDVTPSSILWDATADNHRPADHARAGCPQGLRWLTIPSRTRFYGGYYVGGGVPVKGEGRYLDEGTWGWDYSGILFPKRIALNWSHGARYQGGTGTYKTDGPKRK